MKKSQPSTTERPVFKNALWRSILNEACKKTCLQLKVKNLKLDVISPFGFELTEDLSFLSKNLLRFYCYIGANAAGESLGRSVVENAFKDALTTELKKGYPEFWKDTVLIITDANKLHRLREVEYMCKPGDKLIDIEFRGNVKKDILVDYADYVIALLGGMQSKKIREIKGFVESQISRNRVYQIYIMLEKIFGYLVPKLSEGELVLFRKMFPIKNDISDIYRCSQSPAATKQDLLILKNLIFKRIELMFKAVSEGETVQKVELKCKSYHSNDILNLTLNESTYKKAMAFIRQTYSLFDINDLSLSSSIEMKL